MDKLVKEVEQHKRVEQSEIWALDGLVPDFADRKLLALAARSTALFAALFLPHRFSRPFADQVGELFRIVDRPNSSLASAMCFRGLGKTTICTFAKSLHAITFGYKRCIVAVSSTATKAEVETENIKRELESNKFLQYLVPTIKGGIWNKDGYIANNTYVLPRGANQQIRGFNYMGNRPDFIPLDDLEDKDGVRNEDRRARLLSWFMGDVLGSLDLSKKNNQVLLVGTMLHEDSLLARVHDKQYFPEADCVDIALCDENLKSNYPSYLTDKEVRELYDRYKNSGQLDTFAREYMNRPMNKDNAKFAKDSFKRLGPEEWRDLTSGCVVNYYTIVDPAKTSKPNSADSAIVTFGVCRNKRAIYIADIDCGKLTPSETMKKAFQQAVFWKSRSLSIEVTGLNEYITQPWIAAMKEQGLMIPLEELHARGKKEDRVSGLIPYYKHGYIYHNSQCIHTDKLERQLLGFPYSKLWDIMDAEAYIIPVIENNHETFIGVANAMDEDDEWNEVMSEDEYNEYDDDDVKYIFAQNVKRDGMKKSSRYRMGTSEIHNIISKVSSYAR